MEFGNRVLIFSLAYQPFVGGAEVAIKEITDRLGDLSQNGQVFEFDMITCNLDGLQKDFERLGNINVYRIGRGKIYKYLFPWLAYKKAAELQKKNDYGLIWAIMANQAGWAALKFKKKFPAVKYLLTLQEGDSELDIWLRTWFIRPLYKTIYRRADQIQAISNFLANRAKRMGAECPIKVVPNGVEILNIEHEKLSNELKRVISVSRLVKKNGLEDLVKAVAIANKNRANPIILKIIGEGKLRFKLQKLIENLRINDRAVIKKSDNKEAVLDGKITNKQVYEYLRHADVFVRPSLSEGLGNAFLEAMAMGVPVIGTNVGGIPDFLIDGQTGWFCEVKNPVSIAEKINYVLAEENREKVRVVIDNAKKLVAEKYDWSIIIKRMLAIFESLIVQDDLEFKKGKIISGRVYPEFFVLDRNDAVLNFGCGDGVQAFVYGGRFARMVGVDINSNSLKTAGLLMKKYGIDNFETIESNIETVPLNEQFDKIIAIDSIEHVVNPSKVIAEAHRLLKYDGLMLMTFPAMHDKWEHFFSFVGRKILHRQSTTIIKDGWDPDQHQYDYSPKQWLKLVADGGFELVDSRASTMFPPLHYLGLPKFWFSSDLIHYIDSLFCRLPIIKNYGQGLVGIFKKVDQQVKIEKSIMIAADIFPPDIGGPATYSVELADFLATDGFKVKLICYSDNKGSSTDKFKVKRIKRSKIKAWNYFKYLLALLRLSLGVDIIYAQGPVNAGLPAFLVAKLLGKKLIVKVVGDYAWEQLRYGNHLAAVSIDDFQQQNFSGKINWLKKIESLVCCQADIVITPSDYLKKMVAGWGVDGNKIKTVYNSFVQPENMPSRESARQELGFGIDEFIIVSAGRAVPWKGFGLLHVAISELINESGLTLRLRILGVNENELQEFVTKDLAGGQPINQEVIKEEALGRQSKENVFKYLMAADAFVLNTGYEGLSHVLLETMSCGVPIITTNVCGNPEIVINGINGLLTDHDNKEQLKASIRLLYGDRELGYRLAAAAKKTVFEFSPQQLKERTLKIIKSLIPVSRKCSGWEKTVIVFFAITGFIGIWYALGMVDAVGDEVYFVGGSLKAMQLKTIFPQVGDVPYGTLTYFLNYILTFLFVVLAGPFFAFNSSGLKDWLIQNPIVPSILPRLSSAILALGYLALFCKMVKKEFVDSRVRIFLLLLIFTNMLSVMILHTGKMWVLSTLLVLISFYYLYSALFIGSENKNELSKKNIFLSIFFAWLSFANFPLNFFSLLNIPLIVLFFRKQKGIWELVAKSVLFGLVVFILITLGNSENIRNQIVSIFTNYRPLSGVAVGTNVSVGASFMLNFKRIIAFYPLTWLVLFLPFLTSWKRAIKNRPLFFLALLYGTIYFCLISFLATWSNNFYTYNRYLFPLGFFLGLMIIGLDIRFKKSYFIIGFIALAYFLKTIYLLSVPTTWNLAYDFAVNKVNHEDTVIINDVRALDLPLNSSTAMIYQDRFCGVKCRSVISRNLNGSFKPLVISSHTQANIYADLPASNKRYYFVSSPRVDEKPFAVLGNESIIPGFELEGRMNNYFDFDFWRLVRFGPNIYIYDSLSFNNQSL